jgi:hypothetical protein
MTGGDDIIAAQLLYQCDAINHTTGSLHARREYKKFMTPSHYGQKCARVELRSVTGGYVVYGSPLSLLKFDPCVAEQEPELQP